MIDRSGKPPKCTKSVVPLNFSAPKVLGCFGFPLKTKLLGLIKGRVEVFFVTPKLVELIDPGESGKSFVLTGRALQLSTRNFIDNDMLSFAAKLVTKLPLESVNL